MKKPTPVQMDDRTIRTRDTVDRVGDMMIETDRGPVHAIEAPGFMTVEITRESGEKTMALLLYNPDFDPVGDGTGTGIITQMTPASARTIGLSLLRIADRFDKETPQ